MSAADHRPSDDVTIVGEQVEQTQPADFARIDTGSHVGRYLVLDQLGRGGMGVVYAAYDPELDRKVALKVLHQRRLLSAKTSTGQPRLLREAQALAKLSHPNVITVHDVGTVDGAVFIAMEFLPGPTLADWVEQGQHDWQTIVDVYVAAGRGVAAAHRAGIIHRDFKPDNVMLDGEGRPRVLDFGLARAADERTRDDAPARPVELPTGELTSSSLDIKLTETGALLGTPAYMAPEQHLGLGVDERSDQFSFCVSLYSALFGERPYAGETLAAIAFQVTQGTVREPPRDSQVPGWVRGVLLRGLAPEPDDRYPTLEELLRDLSRDPARNRRRALVGVVLAASVVALAALGERMYTKPQLCRGADSHLVGVWDESAKGAVRDAFARSDTAYAADAFTSVERHLDDYADEWVAMHTEACAATRVRGEQSDEVLTLRMACLDDGLRELTALVDVYRDADEDTVANALEAAESLPPLHRCADIEALRTGVKPPEGAQLREQVAQLRERLVAAESLDRAGKRTLAREQLAALVDEVEDAGYRPLIAETQLAYARTLPSPKDILPAAERAVWMAEASRHDRLAVDAWIFLVFARGQGVNDFEGALDAVARADAAIERIGGDPELRINLDVAHGTVRMTMDDNEAALRLLRGARQARIEGGTNETVAGINDTVNVANALLAADFNDEAATVLEEALVRAYPLFGEDHPAVARLQATLARAQYRSKDYAAAEASLKASLRTFERAHGPDSPQVFGVLNGLALIFDEQRRFDEALDHYERALVGFRKNNGDRHINVAKVLHNMALAEKAIGEGALAVEHLTEAVDIKRELWGLGKEVRWAYIHLGDAHQLVGDLDAAVAHYEAALADLPADETDRDDVFMAATTGLAEVALARGDRDRAHDLLEAAEARYAVNEPESLSNTSVGRHALVLADVLWQRGDRARARELAERSLSRWNMASDYHAPDRAAAQAWLDAHPR